MQILLPILAAPLSLFTTGSMPATADERCAAWEERLKREQAIILERENELSRKVKEDQDRFEQAELERLIERHHASIEAFNLKLDDFNRSCRQKKGAKGETAKARKPGGVHPEAEVQASNELIKTLTGYFIQAGAFKRHGNAINLQRHLAKREIESLIITRPYVYAVWVGPYEDRKSAKAAKKMLSSDYQIEGYIIHFK